MNKIQNIKEKAIKKKRVKVNFFSLYLWKKIKKKIMILCQNTYFGQDEILENSKRITQAKSLSQICDLYRIHKTV